MKKSAVILMAAALYSVAGAGTMVISGLLATVDTSAGPVVLSFDIVSNGQFDNDSIYIWTNPGCTLDIASAINQVNPGQIFDDDPLNHDLLGAIVDVTNVSHPVIWADIAIPHLPEELVGDIISDLGLTITQGTEGWIDVKVLSENSGEVQHSVRIYTGAVFTCIPEGTQYAKQRAMWLALGQPDCWCQWWGDWSESAWGNQCYGDAAGDVHNLGYVVYTSDLLALSNSWKAKIGDDNLDPCADFAHKSHGRGYVVYTDDLIILSTNWKKKSFYLDPENGLRGDPPSMESSLKLRRHDITHHTLMSRQ